MQNVYFDWWDKVKRYTGMRKGEWRGAIFTILVLAFAISFRKWGVGSTVDPAFGLINLLGAIIIVAISFFGRLWIQKATAVGGDYQAEYKVWSVGLLLTLFFVFITNGRLWFLIPGGIIIYYMKGNRLGWVRYGLNFFGLGVVAVAGPFANIILAMIFRALHAFTGASLFYTGFLLNIVWALWQMVPIPPSDGSRMFFGSRLVYMWCLAVVVSSAALLYSNMHVLLTILLSFVVGWIWWLIYYIIWEQYNWRGYM